MWIRTAARDPDPLPQPSERRRWALPGLIAAAAAYAVLELLCGLAAGFHGRGRAEALLFLACRPWLLVAAAAVAAPQPPRARWTFYMLALLSAAAAETIFLLVLGASNPWREALRGLVAGALLVAVVDLALQLGRRAFGAPGLAAAALLVLGLLFQGPVLRHYEELAAPAGGIQADPNRPELMLMTALPIIWGEGGAFDPEARPAASYRMLQAEFRVRPLDTLDPAGLARGRLLLLAQPRALAPEELVALDAWVRAGGRVMILTDPRLVWPSDLPLGDIRRPPAIGLLDPLLTHWGLRLEPGKEEGVIVRHLDGRRLRVAAPGRFRRTKQACAVADTGLSARCRIGAGEAALLADADLMHDALWTGPDGGADRNSRTGDNPLLVADRLDRLVGIKRERTGGRVHWLPHGADFGLALALAVLPLLLAVLAATSLARLRRR